MTEIFPTNRLLRAEEVASVLNVKPATVKDKKRISGLSVKYLTEYSIPTKRSYRSDISRLKHLMPYFGNLYLDEISDYHFEQYRNIRLKEKAKDKDNLVSPASTNREGSLLVSILNKAVKWGFLSHNPLKSVCFPAQ